MDNRLETSLAPDKINSKKSNKSVDVIKEDRLSSIEVKDFLEPIPSSPGRIPQVEVSDPEAGGTVGLDAIVNDTNISGEVNMEALIVPDDVIRAGGFGARDDISSFLPVASDSTDFEAALRDARDYEELQEEVCRPGLGWTEGAQRE
ncbi:uncharacterized protein LOC115733684 isoform X1 [Rhodamnia argentea]|uniref:Uncharacterized protein LOC115733684 isoform X1 n=1 Tax=Rhodamnia argentea TaxID=178133 RepID=A0ABM3GTN1_9MYRT|nr:uncharacterized protein LOC115733684 isoform X1 [Rhodamnia argentea]